MEGMEGRTLDQTPTWAVAGVCAFLVLISILLDKGLHSLGMLLKRKHKIALYEALEKVKDELMVLGFISLLLTFSQRYISSLCIPSGVADKMLPCLLNDAKSSTPTQEGDHERRLLEKQPFMARIGPDNKCSKGYEQIITIEAAHQLHILLFFLAVFHVLYSAMTMLLGRLKIRRWKNWERETLTLGYEFSNDQSRFRLTHQTSFVKGHNSCWARNPFFFYVVCFFRQFFRSIDKSDYLTLRNGFITAHIAPGGKFNFQKYIKRSLEDDFKAVVGISPVLWTSFVVFLLLNVNGWHTLLWAYILPLVVVLGIGMKLQAILTKMALEITDRHSVVQGIPLVQGSDTYFWFSKPRLILHLLHFTLFQNAFQITYFLWILYEFGLESCFHDDLKYELIKITLGIGAMCLCSYSTLPLYALVSQMGSHMKKYIFDEQTSTALKKWHKGVKKKQSGSDTSVSSTLGGGSSNNSPSSFRGLTSVPILHRFLSVGHLSRKHASAYDVLEKSEQEGVEKSTLTVRVDNDQGESATITSPGVDEIVEVDPRVLN